MTAMQAAPLEEDCVMPRGIRLHSVSAFVSGFSAPALEEGAEKDKERLVRVDISDAAFGSSSLCTPGCCNKSVFRWTSLKNFVHLLGTFHYLGFCLLGLDHHHPRSLSRDVSIVRDVLWRLELVHGSIEDHDMLVKAIKNVDVVISCMGTSKTMVQVKIIKAIKEAGNLKRFVPSEFGVDVDKAITVEPLKSAYASKSNIRRIIEKENIPYTFVCPNLFADYFLPTLGQTGITSTPRDKVSILGDGNTKVVFTKEEDIGTFTIRAVDDPRTLNKILHVRPPANTLTMNEIVALWEKKIGKSLEKVYIPEEHVLKSIAETTYPGNFLLAIGYACYVKGSQTYFEISGDNVEASKLYPDVKYTTIEEYFGRLV